MKTDFFVAIAHSIELDSFLAVTELIEDCELQLDKHHPTAGILYASIDVDHQLVLDKIYEKWPELQLIGCTTDGEFSSECEYVEDSLVLTLFISEEIKIVSGFINNTAIDMRKECSQVLSESIIRLGQNPNLCILFSDVIKTSGETVMEQLTTVTDGKLPIVGGISADSWRFTDSKQFYNKVSSQSISPFLLLAGSFDFSFGMDSGWNPLGDMGTITKSQGNVIYEIDHKPALEFYSNILGENVKATLELPIAVYDDNGDFCFMRTSFENYDNNIGSMTYLGNVPVGYKVRITMVNRESILEGAKSSINHAIRTFPSNKLPVIALCFSCSARRVLLGTRTKEEGQSLQEKIGESVKFVGFYSYGEFCPNLNELTNKFYNETFVTVLLG
ncbi:FIST signal transduction protein [Clostridium estertheticum]|uniref:FIST C-terminal domain-containing protein n=1 Tax=Clostridium estertheticum TaxID=238834 RepID=A0AA47EIE7_9CLOT|nr:FIST N-terminal domain-containing protein [Clostridium estertheticum]MBU3153387.1 FIST C-terminal domain-containing protein [Clostridium estertheticum]WAG60792.1 FIST C-terminal domain-containing protein [Clostridium estertheticum]